MASTLALFALFSIGSACGSADDSWCITTASLIGKCTTGTTCVADSGKCTADDAKGSTCGSTALPGRCENPAGNCKSIRTLCDSDGSTTEDCINNGGFIGKCQGDDPQAATACKPIACTSGNIGKSCGATLVGKCVDNFTGKCQYTESVKVEYFIKANKQEETNFTVSKDVKTSAFKDAVTSAMGYSVSEPTLRCPPLDPSTDTNATAMMPGTCSREADTTCKLNCKTGFLAKGNTKKCGTLGVWEGSLGVCEKHCPTVSGTDGTLDTVSGKFVIFPAVHTVAHGKITCENVFAGATCTLSCDDDGISDPQEQPRAVKVQTHYVCHGSTPTWKLDPDDGAAVKGVCQEITPVNASVEVKLKLADDHDKIVAEEDETFNAAFKTAVAGRFGTDVLAENVIITGIKLVPFTGVRRLNEGRRVQVDYIIRVGKGDPEGATELDGSHSPEDDGRLLVGGGLRGIT